MAVNLVDDQEPEPYSPLVDPLEITSPAFFRGILAEFVATLLFLYITVCAVVGNAHQNSLSTCGGVGTLGVAFAFGGTIFVLVFCTAGISGGHINPAITIALALARRITLPRAMLYIIAQCLGAICGAGIAKAYESDFYDGFGGAANRVQPGYSQGTGFAAEMMGTFVLIYTVFVATDLRRRERDAHVSGLAPFSIGFAVFIVHLATIPITGTGINPARSFATAVMFGHQYTWHEQWIFWFGPIVGAILATIYYFIGVRSHI